MYQQSHKGKKICAEQIIIWPQNCHGTTFLMYLLHPIKLSHMDISELYRIFTEYPQVTTDSRDCPQRFYFLCAERRIVQRQRLCSPRLLNRAVRMPLSTQKEFAVEGDSRYILTDDCLTTLQQLANYHRRKLGTKIIGITGTNGKTTTKELVATVLAEKYNVLYTQGNFNNHIGVPKTLLRLTAENNIAVIEMGANHPGEIKTLVNIVEPDYGIITNVGKAHLKGFGSFEGVIRTKGELYDYLREHNGKVFIHNDNEHLLKISSGLSLIKYGTTDSDELSVCGEFLSCDPFLNFRWRHGKAQWNEVRTHMIGSYNIYNMLAAACIGLYFDVTEEQICHALANYVPTNNRSELEVTANNKLIIDAYNANPTSMEAALKNFKEIKADHKMAIIGAMKELGEVSDEEHQKVADMLKALDIEQVWLVGDEFKSTDCPFRKFNNVEEVKQAIDENKPEGFCILIKGSNSTKALRAEDETLRSEKIKVKSEESISHCIKAR